LSLIQTIDWLAVAPPLVCALGALAVLLVDLLLPRRPTLVGALALVVLVGAGAPLAWLWSDERATFCVPAAGAFDRSCSYVVDDVTLVLQLVVLAGAAVVVLMSMAAVREEGVPAGEYYFLLLSSVTGAVTLAAARDLVTTLVALEVLSLPAFALVALRRGGWRRAFAAEAATQAERSAAEQITTRAEWTTQAERSEADEITARGAEAALKVFLSSVTATAVSLFGISLIYGVTAQVYFDRLVVELPRVPTDQATVASVGVVLTLAAFAFKVAAVPFHAWAPDTYQGSAVPVAAYLSVVSKAGGFAGLVLVLTRGFAPSADVWSPVLAVLAAATMTIGNLVALRQTSALRLLAWSSIAQSGYILVPLGVLASTSSTAEQDDAVAATIAYVAVYTAMNLLAFGVVAAVGRVRADNRLDDYAGLARTQPGLTAALVFALACLAGLPPGLVGLFAKIRVFEIPVRGGLGWLAVVMAVNTVVALYYYLVWAARPFSSDGATEPVRMSIPTTLALAVLVTFVTTIGLSIVPGVVLGLP
jgi:NADH-quinone oxidoreductase subunit N